MGYYPTSAKKQTPLRLPAELSTISRASGEKLPSYPPVNSHNSGWRKAVLGGFGRGGGEHEGAYWWWFI